MEITSILIGLILFGASVGFISLPFRQKQWRGVKIPQADVPYKGNRESVFSALRDLDFDFKTGKVSEEDYTPLRSRLVAEAAQYIEAEKKEDDQLEALIQTRRTVQQASIVCEHCGAPMEADQRFCAKCGSPVNNELCPSCGKKIRAGDQFCPSCGNRLKVRVEAVAQS